MGMGEKTRKNIYTRKTRKKSQFGFPPIPPSIKLEADCFPVRKKRKQAEPTQGGTGILIYRDKINKGSVDTGLDSYLSIYLSICSYLYL